MSLHYLVTYECQKTGSNLRYGQKLLLIVVMLIGRLM